MPGSQGKRPEVRPDDKKSDSRNLDRLQIRTNFRFIGIGGAAGYLGDRRKAGLSLQSLNEYLAAAKAFAHWLVRDRRMSSNPLAHLSRWNTKTDVRRQRRGLTDHEFRLFVAAALQSELEFRGVTGRDRAMIYTLAANTGLRAGEVASLTAVSVDLESDQPTISVEAAYSKHRRHDVLPLLADLAVLLRPFLSDLRSKAARALQNHLGDEAELSIEADQDNATAARLWPGTWADRSAEMLRIDLEAARSEWINQSPNDQERRARVKSDFLAYVDTSGHFFDFHSLRHQFITNLARSGASPKEAQSLARHSTITLTMDRYTHLGIVDLTAALDRLPKMPGSDAPEAEANQMLATGTDNARPENVALPVALNVAVSPVPSRPELSVIGSEDPKVTLPEHRRNQAQNAVFQADGEGFEPPVRFPVQQFSRLPP